jgi:hypothetical protein
MKVETAEVTPDMADDSVEIALDMSFETDETMLVIAPLI